MPVRYFLAPYKFRPDAIHPWRYCALDDFTRDVLAEGGDWRESEIDGNRAIVRVRAGAATLARIGRGSDVPIARLDNPASVWTPYRTAPINRGGEIAFDSGRRSPTLPLAEIIRAVRDDRAQEEHVQRVRKPGSIIGYTRRGLPVFQLAGMAFPTQGVIDNFNRASLGGNWTTLLGTLAISGSTVLSCSGTPGIGEYNVSTYGADSECYATVPTVPADGQYVSVLARMTTLSIASTDGYMVRVYKYATTDEWQIHRIDNASATQLGATISQEWAAGDSIGIEVSGSTITAYFKTGGSWSSPGNRSDATYGSAGYLGVIFGDTTARLDDFGGGTISAGGTTYDGGASLKGVGAISGTAILIAQPGGSVAGAGALGAQAQRAAQGNAGLSGAGALGAQGQRAAQGEAGISGVGALNAQGQRTAQGAAGLAGVGAIGADGQRTAEGQAGVAGAGQLFANPQRIAEGNASFAGVGALTSQGYILAVGAAVLQGIGQLYADGLITVPGGTTYTASAFLAGAGALNAEGQRAAQSAISLAGVGTLYADAQRAAEGATALAGAGQLTAFGQRIAEGVAALSAIGLLSGQAQRVAIGGIDLPGAGQLSITVRVQMVGDATLQGAGRLTAYAVVVAQNRGAGNRRTHKPYERVDYEQLRRETHAAPDRETHEAE